MRSGRDGGGRGGMRSRGFREDRDRFDDRRMNRGYDDRRGYNDRRR